MHYGSFLPSGLRQAVLRGAPALALGLLILVSGCDRTRPLPGSEPIVSSGGGAAAAPAPSAPATAAAKGPRKVEGGWMFTFSDPGASSVALAGSFNNWSTSADPLAKGSDGVWSIVKDLPSGSHQYKFVVNGGQWKEDPNNPNSADDGYGGKNSLLQVP